MKKFVLGLFFTALFLMSFINLYGQINVGVQPASQKAGLSIDNIAHEEVLPPDLSFLTQKSAVEEKNGSYKVSVLVPVDYNVDNSGTWERLSDGTDIWRLSMSSEGAKGCVIHFESFELPKGSQLFVYNNDKSLILGPYTSDDNPNRVGYSIGIMYGNEAIIEYVAPRTKSLNATSAMPIKPVMQISHYSYMYRGVPDFRTKANEYGESGDCEININCSDGDDWRIQQKGVAKYYAISEEGGQIVGGLCTGTLINNTSNDGTPYFLTADHCGGTAVDYFDQWEFYFNFESPGCTATSEPSFNTITGCTRKSRGDQDSGSDFLLLELSTNLNTIKNINGVYNGWDRSTATTVTGGGVCIHHPAGDIKKISTYTSSVSTVSVNATLPSSHFLVYWAEGKGVTEGGSSGSPLFKGSNNYVIGTLTGGVSDCSNTSASDNYDYFGRLAIHWESNGSTNADKLQPWLDPTNSGVTVCDYFDPNAVLSVNPTSLNYSPIAQSSTFVVKAGTAASNCTISSSQSWLTLSTASVSGSSASTTVTATVTANTGASDRTAVITVTQGSESVQLEVKQLCASSITYGFSYDFESCTDFAVDEFTPCTTYDGDGGSTYGIYGITFQNSSYTGSYIAFNPSEVTGLSSDWSAQQGNKYGACFSAITASAPNNDWFITPLVYLKSNSELSFYAKSYTSDYGLERFVVLVSTSGNDPEDFTAISAGSYVEAPNAWTQYTYDLSAYDNSNIYVAIRCVSNDAFAFMIDDIKITTTEEGAAILQVSPSILSFNAAGGSETVTVNSSVDWTVTETVDWITLSANAGSGAGSFTVTASPNTLGTTRSATITVSGEGVDSRTITVSQNDQCEWVSNFLNTETFSFFWDRMDDEGIYSYAESFENSTSGTVDTISVYVYTLSSLTPTTSSVKFSLCSDNSGVPGTELASKTLTYSEISTGFFDVAFDSPVSVTGNYFVVVTPSATITTDSISLVSVASRADASSNTAYVNYGGTWYGIGDLFQASSAPIYTSLAVYSHFCEEMPNSCPAPTSLTAIAATNSIGLSWTASDGANSYNVYRGTTLLATVATTSYTDNTAVAGTQYCYTVKAVCESGESPASNEVCTKINVYTISLSVNPSAAGTANGAGSYNQGATANLSVTPNAGYTFQNWTESSNVVSSNASYSFAVTSNRILVANFTLNTYTVTTTQGANGTITPSGTQTYNYGATPTYTITPNAGYHVVDVLVNGASQGAITSYTFPAITANQTITATFAIDTYTVTATQGANGTITPSGVQAYNYGATPTYTITPNDGYKIQNIFVNGNSVGAVSPYIFPAITSDQTITATFILEDVNTYIISASAVNSSYGSISPNGEVSVAEGDNSTFTIIANNGCNLSSLQVDNVDAMSSMVGNTYTFTNVTANHTIVATFETTTVDIVATQGANGTISPQGTQTINYGASQVYTITPNNCYHIEDVLVDNVSVGAVSFYTFNDVISDRTITATFAVDEFTISASAGPNGTISPVGNQTVQCGATPEYTFTPDAGYVVQGVYVNGNLVGSSTSYTFEAISSDQTIFVSFEEVQETVYTITASAGVNGTISPNGQVSVVEGGSQQFTITPDENYIIATLLVDGNDALSDLVNNVYTFTNVTVNHTIAVTFDENSIEEANLLTVKLYPNPTDGILNIVSNEMMNIVEIYTVSGQLVDRIAADEMNLVYNTEILSNGIYVVRISTQNSVITKRFSVEK